MENINEKANMPECEAHGTPPWSYSERKQAFFFLTDFTFFLKVSDPRAGSVFGAFGEARVKDQHVLVPWGLASLKPIPERSVHGRKGRGVYAPCLYSLIPVFSLCKN